MRLTAASPNWLRSRTMVTMLAMALVVASLLAVTTKAAHASDVGTIDFQYTGATAPTGEKPQSKLWYAHSTWWAVMFNESVRDFHIYRYSTASDSWSDTGALVDERTRSYMDVVYDGGKVYVVTGGQSATSTSNSPRVLRYSYQSQNDVWTLDTGFPVKINTGGAEAYVISRDSVGMIWVTFTQGSKVYVTHSQGSDSTWVQKYQLPLNGGVSNVDPDDISTIVSYDGNKTGVLWSNQITQKMYFATHVDGTNDQAWTLDTAYDQPEGADDHMNIKSVMGDPSGRVFAVFKTSMNGTNDPLINLAVLKPNDSWFITPFATVPYQHTRAIVQLDTENREIYVFASAPCCSGGVIYMKHTSMSNPSFEPGLGTPFMASAANPKINNPTSTKQNLDSTTDLIVLAGDDSTHTYVHNTIDLTPNVAPTASFTTSVASGEAPLTVDFTDTSTHGPTAWAWDFGNGTTSNQQNPTAIYDTPGTYTVTMTATNDVGTSTPTSATITVTSPPPPGAGIERRDTSSNVSTTAQPTLTIDRPNSTSAGDLLVSCLASNGSNILANQVPQGWQQIASVTAIQNPRVFGYYKVAGAVEPASYTWGFNSSVTSGGGIARYTGASGLDAQASTATGPSALSGTVPGVNSTTSGAMLVGCMSVNSGSLSLGITTPDGMSEGWDIGGKRHEFADQLLGVPGASGSRTWSFSGSREWAGWLAALRPR